MIITPNNTLATQYDFARTNPEQYKHPAIIGGFGSGKTEAIPLRWISLIEYRAKQKVKCNLMAVEPTKEMIRDILVPSFDLFFDRHKIKHTYHKTYHNYSIRYRGYTFTAMLRSYDNPASLTGKNLTDIMLDEFDKCKSIKDQRDIWTECIARVRQAPFGTVSPVTTPEGYKYTYELYNECDYKDKLNFKLIRAKTYDNFFLPKDYIDNLYKQYSKELVEQYIEAQFVNITQGHVYYPFKRNIHLRELKLNQSLPVWFSFDFNVNPMTTSICQVRNGLGGEQNKVIEVIKALNTKDCNTDKQCNHLKDWLRENNFNGELIITGDATNQKRAESNYTNWEIVKQHFPPATYKYEKSNPAVIDRINSVNSKLLNSLNEVGIYLNNIDCVDLIKDLEMIIWKEGKSEVDKSNLELTHNADNLGYIVWQVSPLRRMPTITHGAVS